MNSRRQRVVLVISGVLRNTLEQTGAARIDLVDDGSPEVALARECCAPLPQADGVRLEARAFNKTALLLTRGWPSEFLLPIGDLWATQVQQLTGGWSAPPDARALIEAAGGIEAVDRALQRWLERREDPQIALADLPESARGPFLEAVRAGRAWRERAGLVPKLTTRTIGIDLFA